MFPRGNSSCLKFLLSCLESASSNQWVKARDDAKHAITYRTAPYPNKELFWTKCQSRLRNPDLDQAIQ